MRGRRILRKIHCTPKQEDDTGLRTGYCKSRALDQGDKDFITKKTIKVTKEKCYGVGVEHGDQKKKGTRRKMGTGGNWEMRSRKNQ